MTQNFNAASQYVYNPAMATTLPPTAVTVPQTQYVVNPQPQVSAPIATQPQTPQVTYNNMLPYINSNSQVFNPVIQTHSGVVIPPAPQNAEPQGLVVYQGPVKTVNPQLTNPETTQQKIENDIKNYYEMKAQTNEEMRDAIEKIQGSKKSVFISAIKFLPIAVTTALLIAYRKKIPLLKKLFTK